MSEVAIVLDELLDGTVQRYYTYNYNFIEVLKHYLDDEEIDYIIEVNEDEKGILFAIMLD